MSRDRDVRVKLNRSNISKLAKSSEMLDILESESRGLKNRISSSVDKNVVGKNDLSKNKSRVAYDITVENSSFVKDAKEILKNVLGGRV